MTLAWHGRVRPGEAVPRRALVVDDDPNMRDLLKEVASDEGYEVHVAHDGVEALRIAGELAPDLIVLDVRMPRMDGLDFLRRYRERSRERAALLVLTALGTVDVPGADAVLAKPFELEALSAAIRAAIQGRDADNR